MEIFDSPAHLLHHRLCSGLGKTSSLEGLDVRFEIAVAAKLEDDLDSCLSVIK